MHTQKFSRKHEGLGEKIAALIAAIILIVCLFLIGKTALEQGMPELEYSQMRAKYAEEIEEDDTAEGEDAYLHRDIDFGSLQDINPEIVAWICIPDTVIDYPVCQGTDNSYYLTHSAEKETTVNGAIFLLPGVSFSDATVTFYGHNMRVGIMFGGLKKYKDDTYMAEHPYVYVYTPETTYKAKVFCAEEVSSTGDAYKTGWVLGSEEYGEWLAETFPVREASGLAEAPGADDQIFMLSTCTSKSSRRYIVCSVVCDVLGK